MSELGELYAALAAARQEFGPLTKNRTVNTGKFSYSYADLAGVIEATAAALAKHGLVVIQDPEVVIEDGKPRVVVHGCIAHSSGAVHPLRALSMPADSNSAQAIGSALTYARRYQLSAALNLAAEDDDDGMAAASPPQTPAARMTSAHPSATSPKTPRRETTTPATTLATASVEAAPEVDPDGLDTLFETSAPTEREAAVLNKWQTKEDAVAWAVRIGACGSVFEARNSYAKIVRDLFGNVETDANRASIWLAYMRHQGEKWQRKQQEAA